MIENVLILAVVRISSFFRIADIKLSTDVRELIVIKEFELRALTCTTYILTFLLSFVDQRKLEGNRTQYARGDSPRRMRHALIDALRPQLDSASR